MRSLAIPWVFAGGTDAVAHDGAHDVDHVAVHVDRVFVCGGVFACVVGCKGYLES